MHDDDTNTIFPPLEQITNDSQSKTLNELPCGFVSLSENFEITFMNEIFTKMVGYTNQEISDLYQMRFDYFVHDDDLRNFQFASQGSADNGFFQIEFRINSRSNTYIWVLCQGRKNRINGVNSFDCVMIDISLQRENYARLIASAEHDGLTKLYNRHSVETLVNNYIESATATSQGAFVILDIDDFKYVNDQYGHLFADTFLIDISVIINSMVRKTDVPGRLGGDEFLIFFKDTADNKSVFNKVSLLLHRIEEVSTLKLPNDKLTCSSGIAFFPQDGQNFEQLYHRADMALYRAKNSGKNRCFCYEELHDKISPMSSYKKRPIGDDLTDTSILSYVSSLLNNSDNIKEGISTVLSFLGNHLDVSRTYIFEDCEDDSNYISNTFEWCNQGITPEIDHLNRISKEVLEPFYNCLKSSNGLYYVTDIKQLDQGLQDILVPQGIKALLQCELKCFGKMFGILGFDDCLIERFWDQSTVNVITEVASLIGIYIASHRMSQKMNGNED